MAETCREGVDYLAPFTGQYECGKDLVNGACPDHPSETKPVEPLTARLRRCGTALYLEAADRITELETQIAEIQKLREEWYVKQGRSWVVLALDAALTSSGEGGE